MKNCLFGIVLACGITLVVGCSQSNDAELAKARAETEAAKAELQRHLSAQKTEAPAPVAAPQKPADPQREAALATIAELEKKLADNPGAFDWAAHNDLRHNYGVIGQEEKGFSHINVILQNSPMDEYTMNIVSGWAIPADIQKAKSNLLSAMEKYPQFPFVTAACLLKLGELETKPELVQQYLTKVLDLKGEEYDKYHKLASEASQKASLREIAELEKKLADNPNAFDWTAHNSLRHLYGVIGQEEKAYSHINVILQNSPMDEYTMNVVSGWAIPADIQKAKSNLLSAMDKYPQFPFVTAACLLKLCELETDPELARQHLKKVMEMKGADYLKYRKLASDRLRK